MDSEAVESLGRVAHGGNTDPELLDFSANTNPRIPSGVTAVYEAALSAAKAYPADDYCEFRAAAADYVGVTGTEIVPAAGSLAGMRLLFSVVLGEGDTVAVPAPSFSEYAREVRLQGAEPRFVDHDAILDVDPAAHELVIVCNPNNPTGECYPTGDLLQFAEACHDAGTVLCVDEAFLDFTDRPTLAGTPGVVVARSLTKMFGLPGLRAGFLVATGSLQERLETVRPTWGMSTPAAAVGTHCLGATEFVEDTRERVADERARMRSRLETRFDVSPSDAPFLLCRTTDPVADVIEEAKEGGVVVRDATTFRGLDSHIRVAVKRPEQNDQLLDALGV